MHWVGGLFRYIDDFAQSLTKEEQRGIEEELTEEELAIFDLLTKPAPELTEKDKTEVKKVAKGLLATLKQEKLVLDWRKKQQARAKVELCIEDQLEQLPTAYDDELYRQKCEQIFQHIHDAYFGDGQSIYAA